MAESKIIPIFCCFTLFKAISTTFLETPSDKPMASNNISILFFLKISKGFL